MNTALSADHSLLDRSRRYAANPAANPSAAGRAGSVLADSATDVVARAESHLARRIASRLDQSAADVPHDVSERLRFARDLALQKARLARVAEAAAAVSIHGGGTAALTAGGSSGPSQGKRWWFRVAAIVPLLTLVGGLVLIQRLHVAAQIKAAADIDAALLADDLPPAAYADPAFAEFLRAPRN